MNETEKIKNWDIPKWHEDYGDPKIEIDILQKFCLKTIELGFNYKFELDAFEEGYISVEVSKQNGIYLEVQITDAEKGIIGLFFQNDDEIYISNLDDLPLHLN